MLKSVCTAAFQKCVYSSIPKVCVQQHSKSVCTAAFQKCMYSSIPKVCVQQHSKSVCTAAFQKCVYSSIPKVNWPNTIHMGIPCGVQTVQPFKNYVMGHLKKVLMSYSLCTTHLLTFWSFHPWKFAQQMDWGETLHNLLTQFRSVYPVPSNPWRQQNFNEQTSSLQFYQPQTITREMKLITKQLFQNHSRYLAFRAKCFNTFGRMPECMNECMNTFMYVCMYVCTCMYAWMNETAVSTLKGNLKIRLTGTMRDDKSNWNGNLMQVFTIRGSHAEFNILVYRHLSGNWIVTET
jgi:hypothetical protein